MNFYLLKALMGSLLVSHVVVAAKPDDEASGITSIGFLGFTIADGIQFFEGIASGVLGSDVRQTWGKCLEDTSEEAVEGYD